MLTFEQMFPWNVCLLWGLTFPLCNLLNKETCRPSSPLPTGSRPLLAAAACARFLFYFPLSHPLPALCWLFILTCILSWLISIILQEWMTYLKRLSFPTWDLSRNYSFLQPSSFSYTLVLSIVAFLFYVQPQNTGNSVNRSQFILSLIFHYNYKVDFRCLVTLCCHLRVEKSITLF